MADQDFIYVRERRLPYETFDADNHLYENRDALTKFMPKEYKGVIKYIEVEGRTKLCLRDQISNYIPNPTFERVAVPGSFGMSVENRGENATGAGSGVKPKAMPSVDAFFDPEPRLALMKDMGIDRTLLWPTLASVLEERVADDPDLAVTIVHALNEWMHEHWTYNYSDAIYATPIISLAAGNDVAIKELDYIAERGAKIFLIRVAPVPTWQGRKSFALKEFDPFWERVQELDLMVGMHSGDPGYQRYLNEWEGTTREFTPFSSGDNGAFRAMASDKLPIYDAMASIIGHGLATRFPKLRFMPVEYRAKWIWTFVERMQEATSGRRCLRRGPDGVFTQRLRAHLPRARPQGPDGPGYPANRMMWGSDFPTPRDLGDPLGTPTPHRLSAEDQELIMGHHRPGAQGREVRDGLGVGTRNESGTEARERRQRVTGSRHIDTNEARLPRGAGPVASGLRNRGHPSRRCWYRVRRSSDQGPCGPRHRHVPAGRRGARRAKTR
jgi:predicted TIM-barrel fold metal-dependent hydrolase